MRRVLFVCTENANRSQMAEAFARRYGDGVLVASSAGSEPAPAVNPRAVEAMGELGIDLSGRQPRSLDEVDGKSWDYVITMGCVESCPVVPTLRYENWDLPDPADMTPDEFRGVRDEIERRVRDLVTRIRDEASAAGSPRGGGSEGVIQAI